MLLLNLLGFPSSQSELLFNNYLNSRFVAIIMKNKTIEIKMKEILAKKLIMADNASSPKKYIII